MTNNVTITGHLTADPELRFTPSGAVVADFTVADTPRRFNKQTQEWEDAGETLFLRCGIWREDAELAAETLTRGQKVTVTGRLKQRSYDKDGQKRVVVEVDAESVAPHQRKAAERSSVPPKSDPWATPAPARQGNAAPNYDEPPF